jgi:uncharacterized protein YozE (UPF0346 family)
VPELAFDKLDWQALATLITGALAVAGAVLIGLRQLAITRRQTDIAERQTRIAELSLRQQLFDKRMHDYHAVANFLGAIIRDASYPVGKIETDFLTALGSSQFLFAMATYEDLQQVWDRAQAFRLLKIRIQSSDEERREEGDADREAEVQALRWFFDRLESLPALFGNQLRLI